MLDPFKRIIKSRVVSTAGWPLLSAALRAPGVIVLMYHRIAGTNNSRLGGMPVHSFTQQMEWLRGHCDPIWPEQLRERARGHRHLRPPVLVTFDDGYRDYHDLAYPVLKRLEIPAIVFLATAFIDAPNRMLWTEELQWAALSTKRDRVTLPWSRQIVHLPDDNARAALGAMARAHLKGLPNADRRAAHSALIDELGAPPEMDRQMLTWTEVRDTMELTRYGGHTHSHPILSKLPRDEAEYEIRTCHERISAETGQSPELFAYPNGRATDFTRDTQDILRQYGFSLAFSTSEGIAGSNSDWFAIKRLPAAATHLSDFAWATALGRA